MHLSEENIEKAATYFRGLPEPIQERILKSIVKLSGRGFTGSGVLLTATDTYALIATARHNVYIAAGYTEFMSGKEHPPVWGSVDCENMLQWFFSNVTIEYDGSSKQANITGQRGLKGVAQAWTYDLYMIFSEDENLIAYAKENGMLCSKEYRQEHKNFYTLGGIYNIKDYDCIQFGFGQIRSDSVESGGPLQFKLAEFVDKKYEVYEVQQNDTQSSITVYEDVLLFVAGNDNTTSKGDSGGPVFAVTKRDKPPKVYLLGVTLGADYLTYDIYSGEDTIDNAVTSIQKMMTS